MSAVKPVESELAKPAYGYGTVHANGATRTFTPPIDDEGEKKQPLFEGGARAPELVVATVRGRVEMIGRETIETPAPWLYTRKAWVLRPPDTVGCTNNPENSEEATEGGPRRLFVHKNT